MTDRRVLLFSKADNPISLLHLRPLRYHNGTTMAQQNRVIKIGAAKVHKQRSTAGKLFSKGKEPKFACKFNLPVRYLSKLEYELESYETTAAMYFEMIVKRFMDSGENLPLPRNPQVVQK